MIPADRRMARGDKVAGRTLGHFRPPREPKSAHATGAMVSATGTR